jgi:hypothetical protein
MAGTSFFHPHPFSEPNDNVSKIRARQMAGNSLDIFSKHSLHLLSGEMGLEKTQEALGNVWREDNCLVIVPLVYSKSLYDFLNRVPCYFC